MKKIKLLNITKAIKYIKALVYYDQYVKCIFEEGDRVIVSRKTYAKRNWQNMI